VTRFGRIFDHCVIVFRKLRILAKFSSYFFL
jgi:hypothetical protein